MKRIFFLTILTATLSGCCDVTPTVNECDVPSEPQMQAAAAEEQLKEEIPQEDATGEAQAPTLWEMTSPDSHIDQGDWCYHDGKKIQVLQVAEEFKDGDVQLYYMICITKPFFNDRMIIGVVSRHAYVTDEMLRAGFYQYLKPHTYQTKKGDSKTIRMYLEMPHEKELTEEEKAEMAKDKQGE